jgi:hypothetical protein
MTVNLGKKDDLRRPAPKDDLRQSSAEFKEQSERPPGPAGGDLKFTPADSSTPPQIVPATPEPKIYQDAAGVWRNQASGSETNPSGAFYQDPDGTWRNIPDTHPQPEYQPK